MSFNKKKVYFRLDAGKIIGLGHYARCSAIAFELEKQNIEVEFIIRKRPSLLGFDPKFKTVWLPESRDVSDDIVSNWIVDSLDSEFQELIKHIETPSVVFIDHYGLTSKYQNKLKENNVIVFGFKDFDKMDCSFTVEIDYRPKASCNVRFLKQGLSYLPLNSQIQNYLNNKNKINKSCKSKVGIYLGGLNSIFTLKACDLFLKSRVLKKYNVEWIVGPDEIREKILNQVGNSMILSGFKDDMFNFYTNCDLFIGAFGVSFFERAFLGVPQLNFIIAENQNEYAQEVVSLGLGCSIGNLKNDSVEVLLNNLENSLSGLEEIVKLSTKLKQTIDSNGSRRIADIIIFELNQIEREV